MDSYEVNNKTCAVVGINDEVTKIIEKEDDYFVNKNSYNVMEDSCQYYGSSCDGRIKGTKMILGSGYKVPIVVEESTEMIFFPTESPYSDKCVWISLNNIESYEKSHGFTKVKFSEGKEIILKMTVASFEMQVLRANRLSALLKKRIDNNCN